MNNLNIEKSTDFFGMTIDELVGDWNENMVTVEEQKISSLGSSVTYFDDLEEYENEKGAFISRISERRLSIVAIIQTVNERICVIVK